MVLIHIRRNDMDTNLLHVIITALITLSVAANSIWRYKHENYRSAIYQAFLSGMLLMGFFHELGKLINR